MHTTFDFVFGEIHQQDGVPDNNPGERDPADHRSRGKFCIEEPVTRNNTNQCQRDRCHDDRRENKVFKLDDHQHVNQHHGQHKRATHVAERFISNRPLTGPLKTRFVATSRRSEEPAFQEAVVNLDTIRRNIIRQHVIHLEHAINRRGQFTRIFTGDKFDIT